MSEIMKSLVSKLQERSLIAFFLFLASILFFLYGSGLSYNTKDGINYIDRPVWLNVTLIVIGLLFFIVAFFYIKPFNKSLEDNSANNELNNNNSNELIRIEVVEKALENKNYSWVIEFGKVLKRFLLSEGLYETRIKIGELVKTAAFHLNDKKSESNALIDYIGWSLVKMEKNENYQKAFEKIDLGIEIARKNNDYFNLTHGYRNLGRIKYRQGKFEKSINYFEQAIEASKNIGNVDDMIDEVSDLYYGLTISYFLMSKNGNNEIQVKDYLIKALENCEIGKNEIMKAKEMFRNIAKFYAIEGLIYFAQNRKEKAIDILEKGVMQAQKENRKDILLRNYIGLIITDNNNKDKNKEYVAKARELANELKLTKLSSDFYLFDKKDLDWL